MSGKHDIGRVDLGAQSRCAADGPCLMDAESRVARRMGAAVKVGAYQGGATSKSENPMQSIRRLLGYVETVGMAKPHGFFARRLDHNGVGQLVMPALLSSVKGHPDKTDAQRDG